MMMKGECQVSYVLEGLKRGMLEEGFRWFEAIYEDWDMRGGDPSEFKKEWGGMSIVELRQAIQNSNTVPLVTEEAIAVVMGLALNDDPVAEKVLVELWKAWEEGMMSAYECTIQIIEDLLGKGTEND